MMITSKGRFKGDMGDNWYMLPSPDTDKSVIEIRKCLGRWLEILVEGYGIMKGWGFQHR